MNIITFDTEEWFIEQRHFGNRPERFREYDRLLGMILDLLDSCDCKATFFCLGKIASDFPYVVKTIAERGHEIGCHSNEHIWLTKLTPEELRRDTSDAIKILEDVGGRIVKSYRAPAFSICESNKWVFEVLAECGIERDSSIFPAVRDFGGFPSFTEDKPCIIERNGCRIKEFPIPVIKILGKELAFSGGGYFRLFPYNFIRKRMARADYGMCYFHIFDLVQSPTKFMSRKDYENYFRDEGSLKNRTMRYIKSNIGTGNAFEKMERIIRNSQFVNLEKADEMMDWYKTVTI